MPGLTTEQRVQREQGLCEVEGGCSRPATTVVSPYSSPLDAKRLCDEHVRPYRGDKAWHLAKIKPR